ncbi:hypothetical protein [Mongoliibacter ruber]|uniref:Outer membrane protein with beta-barrel domain n=1 Tax=Mongoliibacter ruber TaxID=1750599 RepID=A0A2T0WGB4_9BACT|nr:hypothetical protein [Mongoliibacter ruber]PRY85741.1 hypothetical protein CLW00_11184 [Mongoliibacter ruber]
MNTKTILLAALFFFLVCSVDAQNFYKEKIPKTEVLSIGIGPSFIYADNGGAYRSFNFPWNPAASISYTKRFHPHWGLKATAGIQWLESGGNPSQKVQDHWNLYGSAFQFSGEAYHADVMPIFYLFPYINHMNRSWVNLYSGLGIGVMHVERKEAFSLEPDAQFTRANVTTGYVPFRAGISFRLGDLSDIALEGTMLFTFSDNIDGNENFNRFGDHLAQAQIVYKRFLARKKR